MTADWIGELDGLLKEAGLRVKFGLVQQGHIPTVERMRSEGKSWEEIGKVIGWHGPTVQKDYELYLNRNVALSVPEATK